MVEIPLCLCWRLPCQVLLAPWGSCHRLHPIVTIAGQLQPVLTILILLCAKRCRVHRAVSSADLPPVRSACLPVAVDFTKLETEHLPARETREQEISSYKRKAQVLINMRFTKA